MVLQDIDLECSGPSMAPLIDGQQRSVDFRDVPYSQFAYDMQGSPEAGYKEAGSVSRQSEAAYCAVDDSRLDALQLLRGLGRSPECKSAAALAILHVLQLFSVR